MNLHRVIVTAVFYIYFCDVISGGANVLYMKQKVRYNSATLTGLFININKTVGSYQVFVNGREWLTSDAAFFTMFGRTLHVGDELLLTAVYTEDGSDILGQWSSTVLQYKPMQYPEIRLETIFKLYSNHPEVVLFGQRFVTAIKGSSVNNKQSVNSGFPRFLVNSPAQQLGYIAFGGHMFGSTRQHIGRWYPAAASDIESGLDAGPLVLFSSNSNDCVVLSSFTEFMSTSTVYITTGNTVTVNWGILGNVNNVPAGFNLWTILSYSANGINQCVKHWGEMLRCFYGRQSESQETDLTNKYLGYYTDNGAYYYYNTEPDTDYETTLLNLYHNVTAFNLPYRYIQYDSWWYYKAVDGGVKQWTAKPSVFPHGLQSVYNVTGLLSVAHNRWWSNETVYSEKRGGQYKFIVEDDTGMALPLDTKLWEALFRDARKWGMLVYEQDWLNKQFNEMRTTVSQLQVGRQWLVSMGNAAQTLGLTIQYCMATPRHALQTLQVPAVSQVRVSEDYQPGDVNDTNWTIGVTSLLADSLGLAPFKDNFWTTRHQTGNTYNLSEPFSTLHSIVATLSTGPVANSDRIGYINSTLLLCCCNADGLILKPSKPATNIDINIHQKAFSNFSGQVWSTFSSLSCNFMSAIIFAVNFTSSESLTIFPHDVVDVLSSQWSEHNVVYSWFDNTHQVSLFSHMFPLTLHNCTKTHVCLFITSPILNVSGRDVVLLGELSKWVPLSAQRITDITVTQTDITVQLHGAATEHIVFSYVEQLHRIVDVECRLSVDGTATLSVHNNSCQ